MTIPPLQPPGWYPAQGDPPGTNRWWDGAQWVGGPVVTATVPVSAAPYPGSFGASPYAVRPPYAGFWERVAATLLDGFIVGVPFTILFLVYLAATPKETVRCAGSDLAFCTQPTSGSLALGLILAVALSALVLAFYYVIPEGRRGQTLGKRIVGIRTVRKYTGQPLGVGLAIGRYFARFLSSLVCYLGYLWMLWDGEKQTWHDKICNTVVLKARQ